MAIYLPKTIASTHSLCKASSNQQIYPEQSFYSLGMTHYENADYEQARKVFQSCCEELPEAKYQLAMMYYDGLGGSVECKEAVQLLLELVGDPSPKNETLLRCAEYNLGRAYYEGYGVSQSDGEAEKWWLKAATDGERAGCSKAQCILGMFYSRLGESSFDLQKAHYWHQEATANGSLESQGALGVMYEHGIAVKTDLKSSFLCFKSASERGNAYAMGNLALQYYKRKMFTNAADVAKRVGSIEDPIQLSLQTDCLTLYIRKGIAIGCFIYARCLDRGVTEKNASDGTAAQWYSKSALADQEVCFNLKDLVTHGQL